MLLTIKALLSEIQSMLGAYRVAYKKVPIGSNLPDVFVIDKFGLIVSGIDRKDYSFVFNKLADMFPGYRFVFITTTSDLITKKDEILWELMRGGYMHHIRHNFPNQFKTLLTHYGLGRKIINKRLEIWRDLPKYKYLIDTNKEALNQSEQYLLSIDPGFFDFMPEKE